MFWPESSKKSLEKVYKLQNKNMTKSHAEQFIYATWPVSIAVVNLADIDWCS